MIDLTKHTPAVVRSLLRGQVLATPGAYEMILKGIESRTKERYSTESMMRSMMRTIGMSAWFDGKRHMSVVSFTAYLFPDQRPVSFKLHSYKTQDMTILSLGI